MEPQENDSASFHRENVHLLPPTTLPEKGSKFLASAALHTRASERRWDFSKPPVKGFQKNKKRSSTHFNVLSENCQGTWGIYRLPGLSIRNFSINSEMFIVFANLLSGTQCH